MVWRNANGHFHGDSQDASRILVDMSRALNHLHRHKIDHNDIKPGNILYSKQRGAVLCDFGLAQRASTLDVSYGGTPYYVPPEYQSLRRRGPPGDVWALGITMLYVLGTIPLPDLLSVKNYSWIIADVHKGGDGQDGEDRSIAWTKMTNWIEAIRDEVQKLPRDKLSHLVARMLDENAGDRISTATLYQQSIALQGTYEAQLQQHHSAAREPGNASSSKTPASDTRRPEGSKTLRQTNIQAPKPPPQQEPVSAVTRPHASNIASAQISASEKRRLEGDDPQASAVQPQNDPSAVAKTSGHDSAGTAEMTSSERRWLGMAKSQESERQGDPPAPAKGGGSSSDATAEMSSQEKRWLYPQK